MYSNCKISLPKLKNLLTNKILITRELRDESLFFNGVVFYFRKLKAYLVTQF